MGYTPNLDDKSSPYYYGVDSTYKPSKPKPKPQRGRFVPTSPLLANDPELMTQAQFNGGGNNPVAPTTAKPMGGLPSDYKETELKAGETAEAHRPGAGFTPAGRGEVRTNPNGVVQTGTNMGPKPMTLGDANALLSGGYAVQDPFSSNQLPTTGSSLYNKPAETKVFEQNPEFNISTESTPTRLATNMFESGSALEMKDVGDNYQVNSAQAPVSSTVSGDAKEDPKNSGTNWGARTAADNSDANLARRRAFLDAEGSMQGLRRAEATQGIVYAGGQHHMINPNRGEEGQNDFVAIDNKDDVRGYKSGRLSAQDMRDKYVTAITDANKTDGQEGVTSNPDVTQEQPAAITPIDITQAAPEGFNTDIKPMTGKGPKGLAGMYQ